MAVRWRAMAGLAFAVAAGLPAGAAGLSDGFENALRLSAPLRSLEAERAVLAARRDRADALFPAGAALSLGYRTDQVLRDRGLREIEGVAGAPLWLPGEARALRDSTAAEMVALEARIARERLALAGEVRTGWWVWRDAAVTRDAARDRVAAARDLERDLARQVAGGLLPQTDRLAAAAAVREAEAVHREAERAVRAAAIGFRALTGLDPVAGPAEAAPDTAPAGDPRINAATAAVEAGRAAERLARVRDRLNPELALQLRQERDAFREPWGTRIAVLFTLPLGHAPRQRERLATAQAVTTAGLAGVGPAERTVQGGLDRARAARDAAAALAAAAEARYAALAEQTSLFAAAWRGGELPLIELLRARATLAEADAARARAQVDVGRAASDLNQAQGVELR